MAQKIKIDYSQFKASGVYTLEFDNTASVIVTSTTIRLVVGFSNKGPFNTPVYIPDTTTMIAVFGDIDRSLENRGSFFQRSILTCLNAGPVFALNLLKLNDDIDSPTADLVKYRSYSLDTEQYNGILTSKLYSSFYNKERFWFPSTEYFLATLSLLDQGRLFSLVNLGQQPMSVIIRKSTDSTTPIRGYNIFAIDWYGAENVPSFMHPYDYIQDYFIDVIAVAGDWTNYPALSVDPQWSQYFTANGFIKSQMDNFLNNPNVQLLIYQTGCIIPDFVDLNGVNQYIQTLINNQTPETGLFSAIDEKAFDDICNNLYRIDLVGNNLIDELTSDRDLLDPRINFLSYDQALLADYLYTERNVGVTGASGATGGNMYVGTLFDTITFGATGGTTDKGVPGDNFQTYDPNAFDGGYHYLITGTGGAAPLTSSQKSALKTFCNVSSSADQKFIIGKVTIPTGVTGSVPLSFGGENSTELVKLKIALAKTSGSEVKLLWQHPLDTAFYRAQGITVEPWPYLQQIPVDANTPFINSGVNVYQFGLANRVGIDNILNPDGAGVTGFGFPNGSSNALISYSMSDPYIDFDYDETADGDAIWKNSDGSDAQYIEYQSLVDRDGFAYVATRAYSNNSLDISSLENIAAFGASYASDNVGLPVATDKIDIISQNGNINDYIEIISRVDSTTFTVGLDALGNVPLAVGDWLVSTDLNICLDAAGTRQARLGKITTVSATITSGVYRVTCARPVLYYSGTPLRVQKFTSIEDFTTSFDFTYLQGFTMTERHRPNGTDARITELLDVLYETDLAIALANKDAITYRYIIDTFSGQILPNSKYQLSKLAMMRQQALAIINAPSTAQFQASTDPRFTDAPTATNPKPLLNTAYIASGGNLSLNPTYTFSLPSEADGAKFAAFYTPYITIRESNRNVNVPPAALVSNNFVRKFAAGEPYAIVAGQKRGVLAGQTIVGVEYDYSDEDRGNLEPFGLNPIIRRRGVGVVIFGNGTAYQQVSSAFGLVHVRDLLISIENDTNQILSNYLFDFNEDSIRLEIKTLVDNYLDGVRAGGGIYAYKTIMDATNNTPAIIDMNMGVIDIIIEPARGIQKFINRITVTRTGGIAAGGFIQFV
jgi:hypothetical protein